MRALKTVKSNVRRDLCQRGDRLNTTSFPSGEGGGGRQLGELGQFLDFLRFFAPKRIGNFYI